MIPYVSNFFFLLNFLKFSVTSEGSIRMEENEELWVIESDQGDGWTRVRRIKPSTIDPMPEGFVPTSYIETTELFAVPHHPVWKNRKRKSEKKSVKSSCSIELPSPHHMCVALQWDHLLWLQTYPSTIQIFCQFYCGPLLHCTLLLCTSSEKMNSLRSRRHCCQQKTNIKP